jgi:hypothetical protein
MGDETLYTGGEWAHRIQVEALADGSLQDGPFILPLQYHRDDDWPVPPPNAIKASILSSSDWQSFRDEFLSSILPKTEPVGIVLHFYVDDYFLYFDEDGVFQSVVLLEKPPGYAIADRVSFVDFLDRGVPLL